MPRTRRLRSVSILDLYWARVADAHRWAFMRPSRRKLIGVISAVVALGIAAACIVPKSPTVSLNVISVQHTPGSPTARCEISNRGEKPIELTVHSIGQTPFCHRLERPFFSWRGIRDLGLRTAISWRRVGWDMECGIDAEARSLAPGETFTFTASIIDTSQPIRLAVSYRLGGADFTASSQTIRP
jgi:hypothetical protein